MIVYRLQDERGYGPFAYQKKWPEDYSSDKAIHSHEGCTVEWYFEMPFDDRKKWRFGCRNITQLQEYWGGKEELDKFTRDGWVIAKYRVDKKHVKLESKDIELIFRAKEAIRVYE